jgi:hypothetical protein
LKNARNDSNTQSAARTQSDANVSTLHQGDQLMVTLMTDVNTYMKTETLQEADLNSALSAANRLDWVSDRTFIANYTSRQSLQQQEATAVQNDGVNLSNFVRNHPEVYGPSNI